jgi:hypothetical protein
MHSIDIVIAWVDGDDPAHARKRGAYQHDTTESHSEAVVSTRFLNRGEIYYCIASILKYAKFINRIWIITDNQRPAWIDSFAKAGLVEPDFIEIVDHSTVFRGYEKFLPTFNSLSIEAVTWRIPDLAEHFVYLNDDFFLNRPVEPSTFFIDGKPRLRGWYADPSHRRPKIRLRRFLRKVTGRPPNNRPSFRIAQELGAQLAGVSEQFLHVGHHPHPQRRSVLEAYYAEHPDVLERQVSYRFRSVEQYLPVSLANHLELARHGAAVEPEVEVAYVKPSRSSLSDPAFADIRDGVSPYGCIQSLDECSEQTLRAIRPMMEQKFGEYLPEDIRIALNPVGEPDLVE